ncbi:MAG: hypothetical protein ACXVZL_12265 [Gaiellaceae bacterium]
MPDGSISFSTMSFVGLIAEAATTTAFSPESTANECTGPQAGGGP